MEPPKEENHHRAITQAIDVSLFQSISFVWKLIYYIILFEKTIKYILADHTEENVYITQLISIL